MEETKMCPTCNIPLVDGKCPSCGYTAPVTEGETPTETTAPSEEAAA